MIELNEKFSKSLIFRVSIILIISICSIFSSHLIAQTTIQRKPKNIKTTNSKNIKVHDNKQGFISPRAFEIPSYTRKSNPTGSVNGHIAVDMGLSVRWASVNVNGLGISDQGDWFLIGETIPYRKTRSNISLTHTSQELKSYNESVLTGYSNIAGDGRLDAATNIMGKEWRIPSADEFEELKTRCIWEWTSIDGIYGAKITGPSGQSIFLPTSRSEIDIKNGSGGFIGHYHTSSFDSQSMRSFRITRGGYELLPNSSKLELRCIRAVCD